MARWAAVALFTYGTIVHVVQLAAGGTSAYLGVPGWLAAFFTALVVLDPVATIVIALRKRWGWAYGTAVLALDAVANGVANYPPIDNSPGITAGRVGQSVITVLAVAMAVVWWGRREIRLEL